MRLSSEARPLRYREDSRVISGKRREALIKALEPISPQEREVLEQNKRLRLDAQQKVSKAMALELSFPDRHLRVIKAMIPELQDKYHDKELRVKTWKRFLADPISRPYKVQ